MKIGAIPVFSGPVATPDCIRAAARAIDAGGFHSLWVPEHVVLFDAYASRYPYSPDGRLPAVAETGIFEPLDALAYLAAVTERVRLATGICLVPQRNPVYTAKQTATIDQLSGGRLDFGVGIGWLREEFEAVDVPWERRGERTAEYVRVIRTLWCDEVSSWDGEFYRLPPCRQYPKPVQTPHPPIHFGGESDAALRRTAELGQGWYGFDLGPDELAERLDRLDPLLAQHGRSRSDLVISTSPGARPLDLDLLARYRDAGADQVNVACVASGPERLLERIDRLAEQIVAPAADL